MGCVHIKIKMGMARPIFLGLKFGQILFFLGVSKTGIIFFRLHEATATVALFTHDCNVISRNYCIVIVSKICNPAAPVHSAREKFADSQCYYQGRLTDRLCYRKHFLHVLGGYTRTFLKF